VGGREGTREVRERKRDWGGAEGKLQLTYRAKTGELSNATPL
jgi:hypothetical protein